MDVNIDQDQDLGFLVLQVHLVALFWILPNSESRHSFVANNTSAVIFVKHILVRFCCIIIPLYVCVSKYWNVICLMLIISISPWPIRWRHILHMCQYLNTAYFGKILSFEMLFFIWLSVLACFPTFTKTYPRKKRTFYSVFGSVIAVRSLTTFFFLVSNQLFYFGLHFDTLTTRMQRSLSFSLSLCLIWFFTSKSTIFQFCQDGSSCIKL